jgi:hypothetical protein
VVGELVEFLSGGSLMVMLILVAVMSLLLGMGLPTTANYIVTATLLAPVIISLAASHGLEVPLIAVHLFVFYYGIMADATPPVALAAYAAAGLSGADPLETGIQGFIYELRTAILPFMFIFNTELLMINIGSPLHFGWVLLTGLAACFAFAAATHRYFIVASRWWETVALLLVTFTLFRPDIYRDWFHPPFKVMPAAETQAVIASLKPGENMRLRVEIEEKAKDGEITRRERTFILPVSKGPEGGRLARAGVEIDPTPRDGKLEIVNIVVDSPAEKARLDVADKNRILGVEVRNPQPDKAWFTIPGWILLAIIVFAQRRRLPAKAALPA